MAAARRGVIARYATWLPVTDATPPLTLDEGDTPLVDAPLLAQWVGVARLTLKCEGQNPTGSFKDRGMVVAVAKAAEAGARTVLCASTGNTSASAAAYAARAGLIAVVLLPKGKVAAGKLAQAFVHGARVVALETSFDGALDVARLLAERYPIALVNSVNPHRIEGQSTAAFEICDRLGRAPDVLALPVGNGGNITAYWRGFTRYRERGLIPAAPRILGVQAAGAAPLVHGRPVEHPETLATAIRIGRPASWDSAVQALRESSGAVLAVSDDEILSAYREIGRREGVFCEPASAASVAGLKSAVAHGLVPADALVTCVLTGHGLKDPGAAEGAGGALLELAADAGTVARALGW